MEEQKSCLNCKYIAHAYVSITNPKKALFYCDHFEEIMQNTGICQFYQKKSRLND